MSIQVFQHVKDAIRNLDPEDIRKHTERPLRLLLYADSERQYRDMEDYLLPRDLSAAKRAQVRRLIYRGSESAGPRANGDLEIYFDPSRELDTGEVGCIWIRPGAAPRYSPSNTPISRPDLAVPLALHVLPFREEVSRRMVKKIAKENALFSLATALPDIVPFISLPWAMGEFASDTAFLTANQIRMAFLLAAANDRDIGYHEQRGEIASIILGAFGWRALARELVGKIPWGGGLMPKAAIAYAGTRVVGLSLERYYRLGKAYTRAERRLAYQDALERGKQHRGRPDRRLSAARLAPQRGSCVNRRNTEVRLAEVFYIGAGGSMLFRLTTIWCVADQPLFRRHAHPSQRKSDHGPVSGRRRPSHPHGDRRSRGYVQCGGRRRHRIRRKCASAARPNRQPNLQYHRHLPTKANTRQKPRVRATAAPSSDARGRHSDSDRNPDYRSHDRRRRFQGCPSGTNVSRQRG